MIDTPAKMKVLRRSIARAVDRLAPPEAFDVYSPIDLRDLILLFIRLGGRCEDLFRLFEEADRPTVVFARPGRSRTAVTSRAGERSGVPRQDRAGP